MLVGEKEKFAVDIKVSNAKDQIFYGYCRLWICNESVGDFEAYTCINSSLIQFRKFTSKSDQRDVPCLMELSANDALMVVNRSVYESVSDSELIRCGMDLVSSKIVYPIILIPNGTEPFDGWRLIVINAKGRQRVIWKGPHQESAQSVTFDSWVIEEVLNQVASATLTGL